MIGAADRRRLLDIIDYAGKAIRFLGPLDAASLEDNDEKLFAVIRAVEVVGEAASRLSKGLQTETAHLPWRDARNMRNLLIHAYPEVRVPTLVETVRNDFPQLIADIEALLKGGAE